MKTYFESSEDRVIKANVDTSDAEADVVGLVGLKRRGDGQVGRVVTWRNKTKGIHTK